MNYRADIDGLRAIAVGSVILYHLNFRVSGGFAGVDVFFVISGFLITGIIQRDIAADRFSINRFYERRIRRIAPALFGVLGVSTIGAWLWLMPASLELFGQNLVATGVFGSNLLLWWSTDYFAADASNLPLLHVWSLAVEEQFYFAFPWLLVLVRKLTARKRLMTVWAICILSFLLCVWWTYQTPETAFYLLPARAWELLLGSLLALGAFKPTERRWMREAIGVLGLLMMTVGFFVLDHQTPFPGAAALLPCVGTGLIIYAGGRGDTVVDRLLGLRPLAFLGLISYSLYLWHWPLIVFWKQSLVGEFTPLARVGLLVASIVLATLSWKFIEQPIRSRAGFWSNRRVVGAFLLCTALVLGAGFAMSASGGFPSRLPAGAAAVAATQGYDAERDYRRGLCFLTSATPNRALDRQKCLNPTPGKRNVLLIGDSHAAHLWPGLNEVFHEHNILQGTVSGCRPLLDSPGAKRCLRVRDHLFNEAIPDLKPDTILLAAGWKPRDLEQVPKTVAYLRKHSRRVIVLGPIVEYSLPLPHLVAVGLWKEKPELVDQYRVTKSKALDRAMRKSLADAEVDYRSLYDVLCSVEACIVADELGVPIQFDYGHLTGDGSILLARLLRSQGFLVEPD
jgi:peptidoglycan/LPS O-acetylase OafA/YrhL